MSKLPPCAVLLATLAAVVCVIAFETPSVIVGLATPALLFVLASAKGRRRFGRRLLVSGPLVVVALAVHWRTHDREPLSVALRVVSAVAWASCLSTWLEPREMRAAFRALGAPAALVELIAHTRRFASQLAETACEAWNAAALRAGLLSLRAAVGTVGQIAGVIFVRAFDRAECVAIAGALRGGHLAEDALREAYSVSQDLGGQP